MKKLMMTSMLLAASFVAIAATQIVTIKEVPVELKQEGDVYVIPDGTTSSYYYYNQSNVRYVCARTQPDELVGITSVPLKVRMGTTSSQVYCYPNTYFVVPSN